MIRGRSAALALFLLAAPVCAASAVPVPPLTGPVVDPAGVLDARWEKRLGDLSRAAREQKGGAGPQLQYLVVSTLDGEAIEDFSMRVAEAWKLGTKGRDDGVLVVVAVKDRKVRIEVGGGLEGGLTDAQSGRIIRTSIVPAFREGRYGEGLYAAGQQILGALGSLPEGSAQAPSRQVADKTGAIPVLGALLGFLFGLGSPVLVLLIIAFIVIRAIAGIGGRGPRGPRSPWGGGGFGGGAASAAVAAGGAAAVAASAAAAHREAGRSEPWPSIAISPRTPRSESPRRCAVPSRPAPGRWSRWWWSVPSPTRRPAGSPP